MDPGAAAVVHLLQRPRRGARRKEVAILQTPITTWENTPAYRINLDDESFKWEAIPETDGLPTYSGTMAGCLRFIAAEQGWSAEDLAETLAYNEGS